jgi:hypothetical protein
VNAIWRRTCAVDEEFNASRIESGKISTAFTPIGWAVVVVAEAVRSTYFGTPVATWADCTAHTDCSDIVAGCVEPILSDVVGEVDVCARGRVARC